MSDAVHPTQDPPDTAATAERQALDRVVEALQVRFPEVPVEVIAREVAEARGQFADAPVREFVPVLVERQVRALLTDTVSS